MSIQIELQENQELDVEEITGGIPGAVGGRLTGYIFIYLQQNDIGRVFNADTDFVLPGIGKRRPDVAYASYETVPELTGEAVPVPPDLVVEIVSKTDQTDVSDLKILEYQQAKIKLIWVVRTVLQVIEVYRADKPPSLLQSNDLLDGEDVLPGFTLPVNLLFKFKKK